jgi:hypothetical protein
LTICVIVWMLDLWMREGDERMKWKRRFFGISFLKLSFRTRKSDVLIY